jgi:hypothetical protein
MRVDLRYLGFALAVSTAGALFAACGGEISQSPGGAGTTSTTTTGTTTGMGGASTTTSTTTTTVITGSTTTTMTTTTTTTTSTGLGGGTPCEQGCKHLEQCNLGVTCAQFNVDCATIGNQFDCQLECVNATPCAQLGLGTLQTCNAQCMGQMDGGMMGGNCQGCAIQQCQGEAFACGSDQTCMAWLGCVNACSMASPPVPTCVSDCDAQFVGAKPLYDALYTCTCANCMTECAANDPCSHAP